MHWIHEHPRRWLARLSFVLAAGAVVIGPAFVPTDGVLAYRLGFTFLHYTPQLADVPLGPALMHRWGELVRPLVFRRV